MSIEFVKRINTSDLCNSMAFTPDDSLICGTEKGLELRSIIDGSLISTTNCASSFVKIHGKKIWAIEEEKDKLVVMEFPSFTDLNSHLEKTAEWDIPSDKIIAESFSMSDEYLVLVTGREDPVLRLYPLKDNKEVKTCRLSEHLTNDTQGKYLCWTYILPDGHVLVTDPFGGSVSKFWPEHDLELIWKLGGIDIPTSVFCDSSGFIYVTSHIQAESNPVMDHLNVLSPLGE